MKILEELRPAKENDEWMDVSAIINLFAVRKSYIEAQCVYNHAFMGYYLSEIFSTINKRWPVVSEDENIVIVNTEDNLLVEQKKTGSNQQENPFEKWKQIPENGYDRPIVKLFCEGRTNVEIGKTLHLASKTVTNRISELRQKFPVPTREELRRATVSKIHGMG